MSSNIKNWSKVAANNNSAPPSGWPEGMAPSTVNNTARQQMADHRTQWEQAEWFDWGHTPVYQSANSFLVSLTATDIYTAGRRLRLYDATTIYAEILASSPSGTNTLVTISASAITSSLSSLEIAILDPANQSQPTTMRLEVLRGPVSMTASVIPASAGASMVRLAQVSISATIEAIFASGIDATYDVYRFVIANLIPTTGGTLLVMQVSEDGGATWKSAATDYARAFTSFDQGGNTRNATGATTSLALADTVNGMRAGDVYEGEVTLWTPAKTSGNKHILGICGYRQHSTSAITAGRIGGAYIGTTNAVNGVKFTMASGATITAGVITMYGLKSV